MLSQLNCCAAFRASVIAGSAFVTARTFNPELILNNVVLASCVRTVSLANVAGIARRNLA
jgi:hypothetical protein